MGPVVPELVTGTVLLQRAAVSLWGYPRHPSEAGAHGDAVGADTSCSEMPEAGAVFGEKQPPQIALQRNTRQAFVFALQFITEVCHSTMGRLMWNITLTIFYIYVALFISKGP